MRRRSTRGFRHPRGLFIHSHLSTYHRSYIYHFPIRIQRMCPKFLQEIFIRPIKLRRDLQGFPLSHYLFSRHRCRSDRLLHNTRYTLIVWVFTAKYDIHGSQLPLSFTTILLMYQYHQRSNRQWRYSQNHSRITIIIMSSKGNTSS